QAVPGFGVGGDVAANLVEVLEQGGSAGIRFGSGLQPVDGGAERRRQRFGPGAFADTDRGPAGGNGAQGSQVAQNARRFLIGRVRQPPGLAQTADLQDSLFRQKQQMIAQVAVDQAGFVNGAQTQGGLGK